MKSKIINKEPDQAKIKYPCLMAIERGPFVFLMNDEDVGICVHSPVASHLGNKSVTWSDSNDIWIPFTGTIELSND